MTDDHGLDPILAASQDKNDPLYKLDIHSWESMAKDTANAQIFWHWVDWTQQASLTLVSGDEESLKTLFVLFLAMATADGLHMRELYAGGPPYDLPEGDTDLVDGPVIYVSAENGYDEELRRFQAIRRGLDLPDTPKHKFYFVNGDTLSLRLSKPRNYDYQLGEYLDDDRNEEVEALFDLIERVKPVMIVFDTVAHLADLENENDNAVVRRFIKERLLPVAREHDAALYVIVQPPKRSQVRGAGPRSEVRGAGSWRHAADTTLFMQRAPTLGKDAAIVTLGKVRRGSKQERRVGFRVTDVDEGVMDVELVPLDAPITSEKPASKLEQAVEACLEILDKAEGGLTVGEVNDQAKALGHKHTTIAQALDVIRGKALWPYGPHKGGRKTLVRETGKQGTEKRLVLLEDAA